MHPVHSASRMTRIASLVFACSTAASAQILVGPIGSGAPYQEISAAVAAAPVGASILVQSGSYQPFTVSQGVSIVAIGTTPCLIAIPAGTTTAAIEVTQVAAGEVVRITGLTVDRTTSASAPRIHLHQCAGRVELVHLESLRLLSANPHLMDKPLLLVEDCDAVQLDGCVLHGSHPPLQQAWQRAQVAMQVNASRVWCTSGTFLGGHGFDSYGGDAIRLAAGSFLHLTRTSVVGGNGGAHFGFYWWDIYGFAGEEGIEVNQSELVLAGGPGNLVEGGMGVQTATWDWTSGGAAVRAHAGGIVRYTPDSVLVPGLDGNGQTTTPAVLAIVPSSTEIAEPDVRATLAVAPSNPPLGSVVNIESSGRALAIHAVFAGFVGVTPVGLPIAQHLHVDPTQVVLVAITTLDPAGLGSTSLQVPSTPATVGAELVLQAIDVNLSSLRLTNAALLTVVQ